MYEDHTAEEYQQEISRKRHQQDEVHRRYEQRCRNRLDPPTHEEVKEAQQALHPLLHDKVKFSRHEFVRLAPEVVTAVDPQIAVDYKEDPFCQNLAQKAKDRKRRHEALLDGLLGCQHCQLVWAKAICSAPRSLVLWLYVH